MRDGNERAPVGANDQGSQVTRWLKATAKHSRHQQEFKTMRCGDRYETSCVYGRMDLSPTGLRGLHAHLGGIIAAEDGQR